MFNLGEIEIEAIAKRSSPSAISVSPSYFKRTVSTSNLLFASLDFGSQVNLPKPKGQAAKAGLRFEKKVISNFSRRFQRRFAHGIPMSFKEKPLRGFYSRPSIAIPDGFLLSADSRTLCLVEIKLRHSVDAWSQLNRFYLPILRKIVGDSFILRSLEVCLNYDPAVRLPVEKNLILDPEEIFSVPLSCHSVLIWERF